MIGDPQLALYLVQENFKRYRFKAENIARAQQETMNCTGAGIPTEPVMSRAVEGMAKQAIEQQIIAAMATMRSRYAQANLLAKSMSKEKQSISVMTHTIADSLAAGMRTEDVDKVMAQIRVQTQEKAKDMADNEKMAIQTMQTARTMARLGTRSADVSDTLCQALHNNYNHEEMKQLRH